MSKLEKLLARVDRLDPNIKFKDIENILIGLGYTKEYPGSGSSHCTFRKKGCNPITIPNKNPIKKPYIILVKQALKDGGVL